MDKAFTPHEVDLLLPKLEAIFTHIETCQRRTQELAATRPPVAANPSASEIADAARIRSQMEFLLNVVQDDIQLIAQLGGVVKDVEAGLVDFLGFVEGQDVWLCWKRGESKIHFWHPLHAGFSERQRIARRDVRPATSH